MSSRLPVFSRVIEGDGVEILKPITTFCENVFQYLIGPNRLRIIQRRCSDFIIVFEG